MVLLDYNKGGKKMRLVKDITLTIGKIVGAGVVLSIIIMMASIGVVM